MLTPQARRPAGDRVHAMPSGGGRKDGIMNTRTNTAVDSSSQSRFVQLAIAGVAGLCIVWLTGFAPMEVAHNAAHDHRHSLAFPCH